MTENTASTNNPQIAFIGLGNMGGPMAKNLLKKVIALLYLTYQMTRSSNWPQLALLPQPHRRKQQKMLR